MQGGPLLLPQPLEPAERAEPREGRLAPRRALHAPHAGGARAHRVRHAARQPRGPRERGPVARDAAHGGRHERGLARPRRARDPRALGAPHVGHVPQRARDAAQQPGAREPLPLGGHARHDLLQALQPRRRVPQALQHAAQPLEVAEGERAAAQWSHRHAGGRREAPGHALRAARALCGHEPLGRGLPHHRRHPRDHGGHARAAQAAAHGLLL